MSRTVLALILIVGSVSLKAQNIEGELKRVAHNVEFAVLPVWYTQSGSGNQFSMQVVGTAFLVTPDGYFVTAAHVLQDYKPKSAQMTVGLRQRSGSGSGIWFDLRDGPPTTITRVPIVLRSKYGGRYKGTRSLASNK